MTQLYDTVCSYGQIRNRNMFIGRDRKAYVPFRELKGMTLKLCLVEDSQCFQRYVFGYLQSLQIPTCIIDKYFAFQNSSRRE